MAKDKKKSKDKAENTEAPVMDLDDLDPKAPGDGASIKDLVGELLLVIPTGTKRDFVTSSGTADLVIVADIIVLDEDKPKKSKRYNSSLIFQKILVGALEDRVGKGMIAAKLVMGQAGNGKSAPYLFETSAEAKTAARAYLASIGPKLD